MQRMHETIEWITQSCKEYVSQVTPFKNGFIWEIWLQYQQSLDMQWSGKRPITPRDEI